MAGSVSERRTSPSPGAELTAEQMGHRLVRYGDLVPCRNAFIDTRSPGSEAKENFTIIGPGVSENPAQYIHIGEPHGFNIGAARQPPNCINSQHSHETAEVFVVHAGTWTFNIGETGSDVRVGAGPGSVVSIPTGMFRGFTNVGSDVGFLWVVLGGDDPGRVKWAPYVFDMAKDFGLVLLEDGRLVDTLAGETPPPGARRMPKTTREEVARMRIPSAEEVRSFCVLPEQFSSLPAGPLSRVEGVDERSVLGPASNEEAVGEGALGWPHGFHLRRLVLDAGAAIPTHTRLEREVIFVHHGRLVMEWGRESLVMEAGDTLTIPVGAPRRFRSPEGCVAFVVRGGDHPAAPVWIGR